MNDFAYTVWYDVPARGQRGSGHGFRTKDEATSYAALKVLDGYANTWIEDHEAERAKLVCLDGPDGCRGPVDYHSVDGLKAWPRCEGHFAERLDLQERINRDYPDSPSAPDWFDESYAGERWDDDY